MSIEVASELDTLSRCSDQDVLEQQDWHVSSDVHVAEIDVLQSPEQQDVAQDVEFEL